MLRRTSTVFPPDISVVFQNDIHIRSYPLTCPSSAMANISSQVSLTNSYPFPPHYSSPSPLSLFLTLMYLTLSPFRSITYSFICSINLKVKWRNIHKKNIFSSALCIMYLLYHTFCIEVKMYLTVGWWQMTFDMLAMTIFIFILMNDRLLMVIILYLKSWWWLTRDS